MGDASSKQTNKVSNNAKQKSNKQNAARLK